MILYALAIESQFDGEMAMNLYEDNLVLVDDEDGRAFICTLEHKCSEYVCSLDSKRKIPNKLEELTEHERCSCTRYLGSTYRGKSGRLLPVDQWWRSHNGLFSLPLTGGRPERVEAYTDASRLTAPEELRGCLSIETQRWAYNRFSAGGWLIDTNLKGFIFIIRCS